MTEKPEPTKESWTSYPETILVFAGDPEMVIDLREEVSPATKNALVALGFGESFAVLTSFNPRGETIDAKENERRFAELEAELRSTHREFLVMDACSPGRLHCECGFVLKVDRKVALAIARRWEQLAIFWFEFGKFWIYGAISERQPIELPGRIERLSD